MIEPLDYREKVTIHGGIGGMRYSCETRSECLSTIFRNYCISNAECSIGDKSNSGWPSRCQESQLGHEEGGRIGIGEASVVRLSGTGWGKLPLGKIPCWRRPRIRFLFNSIEFIGIEIVPIQFPYFFRSHELLFRLTNVNSVITLYIFRDFNLFLVVDW